MSKQISLALLAIIALFGLTWAIQGNDFFLYKFFAPKTENVRRQVFENTQSYIQGKTSYLSELRFAYQTANPGHKQALRTQILSEASTVDNSKLPADLQGFITDLKGGN